VAANKVTIIIADDDNDDKSLLIEAFLENGMEREQIILASDGEELLSILPAYANIPCIVFLDLNMPRKNGLKVLSEIKADQYLRHIPILIFTTSNSRSDIHSCYDLGSNTYFTKPFSYTELINLVGAIKTYWFEKATLTHPLAP
jgi:CheY-like chemotaxis protein